MKATKKYYDFAKEHEPILLSIDVYNLYKNYHSTTTILGHSSLCAELARSKLCANSFLIVN